jgi:hypothetical protein
MTVCFWICKVAREKLHIQAILPKFPLILHMLSGKSSASPSWLERVVHSVVQLLPFLFAFPLSVVYFPSSSGRLVCY